MFVFALIVYWLDRMRGRRSCWIRLRLRRSSPLEPFHRQTFLGLGLYLFTGSETAPADHGIIDRPAGGELKGFAVVAVFLLFRHEFDTILDGITYAAIAALGFAATENAYYIFSYGYLEYGLQGALWLFIVRVFLVGWQHPFYTAFTGIGLAIARLNRNAIVKIAAPVWVSCWPRSPLFSRNTWPAWRRAGRPGCHHLVDWSDGVMFLFILWALPPGKSAGSPNTWMR
jgi:hypothetical protein